MAKVGLIRYFLAWLVSREPVHLNPGFFRISVLFHHSNGWGFKKPLAENKYYL